MTRTRRATLALGIALTAATVAGCDAHSEPAPPSSTTEAAPLSGVGAAGRSPEQQATEGAINAVKGMHAARDAAENDPRGDINAISQYVAEPYLGAVKADLTTRRSQGITATGNISIIRTSPEEVTAPKDAKGNPVKGRAEVLLKTCADISQKRYTGAHGEDQNRHDLPGQVQAIYRVVDETWPAGDGWRVLENTSTSQESCDAG